MKFYVGLFSIVFVLGLVFIFWLIMEKKGFFDKYNRYYFITQNAQTFYIGMPLLLSGFEIGNIESMKLLDNSKVKIGIKVKSRYQEWITRDTKLIINRPLIGSPTIDVVTKSKIYPLMDNQEIKRVIIKDDIDDIIAKLQPIVKKLQKIVDNVEIATNKLASKDSTISRSLRNIEKFTAKLASDKPFLTLLTGDENSTKALSIALANSSDVIDNLNGVIKEANSTIAKTEDRLLPPLFDSAKALKEILLDIQNKLSRLNGVVNELSSSRKDIKRLKRDIRVNMHKTNRVINRVDSIFKNPKPKVELP
jgi:ABC-type transporter Mla subunit MlaD